MNVKIDPQVWNSFTPVQKRAIAESLEVNPGLFGLDLTEIAAWATTLLATGLVAVFATLLFH
jgi:hypothetical protein